MVGGWQIFERKLAKKFQSFFEFVNFLKILSLSFRKEKNLEQKIIRHLLL